jgi:WD40 repeat protein
VPIAGYQTVFISYARQDGAELARRLQNDLNREGFETWVDTQRIAGGASWTIAIEEAIDRAQAVLAIVTRGSFVSSICRAEQLRSLRKGKKVIPLLGQTGADVPLHLEAANYRDFASPASYHAQLRLLLQDLATGENAVTLRPEFVTTLVTAPPLPRIYLPRLEALARLRDAVITDEPGSGIALTALNGMGGIGKTVLAQALCQEEAVQQAFPDGIVWTTIGKEPAYSLIERMQEVRRALGDAPPAIESELHCINRYRTILREKAALVVVDDVWRSQDIAPFLAESPRSRLLFTTRDEAIANATGARRHPADLLTEEQARGLLAEWTQNTPDTLPHAADGLVKECGRLPLALSMVGAMLSGKPLPNWSRVLARLQQADLGKIRAQFPLYPHADMLRAIQVSVDALREEDAVNAQRYLALAVMLEDMAVAPAVQRTLWNVDQANAIETAERFVGLSLAQRDGDDGSIRLHDLQLDYVRSQYPDRGALDLIHSAVRLSLHVLKNDARQFASQIIGRLLPHCNALAIGQFTTAIADGAPAPWLRPLRPALHPAGTALICMLQGHSGIVNGVAVSADGRRAVSASSDRTLKVWDLETGRALCKLEGHSDHVNGVAVSADGRRAVSASDDNTLKVWDLELGRELRTLQVHPNFFIEGHLGLLKRVAASADGRLAVSASLDNKLKVWDLETGSELRTLQGHSDRINAVAVSADGRRAVSASDDNTLKVWDLETGRELRVLQGHSGPVNTVAVTGDGRWVVSTSSDHTLKVWDLEAGRELRKLQGGFGSRAAVSADGRRAVSFSDDYSLKVWDLETGSELCALEGHSSAVNGVAVSADERRAVSASDDHTLKVWDLETGSELCVLEGHSSAVKRVAASADGRRAVSASNDNTLKVWDLETGRELRTLRGHSDRVNTVAVTEDGRQAVSASDDHTLKVWDLETGSELCALEGHSDRVKDVALSGDGRRAVSVSAAFGWPAISWDSTLKVWDLEARVCTAEGRFESVNRVAVSVDGQLLVFGSQDKTLNVWDLETRALVATFTCDASALCCAFINSRKLIAGDASGRVHFLSVEWERCETVQK